MSAGSRLRRAAAPGLAALLLAASLVRPGFDGRLGGVEHLVVLDISQSMNVADRRLDGHPVSRLDFAKRLLHDAVAGLPCGSRVGLGAFSAHRSLLLMAPLEVCEHLAELQASLAFIDGRMAWAGGSEIAKGLHGALIDAAALPRRPSVVFVTDGHEAPPLNPRHRPDFAGETGAVQGLVVGVGGFEPAPIPLSDAFGRQVGWWDADDVAQHDPFSQGRGTSVEGERFVEADRPGSAAPLGATPGREHRSALREPYLGALAAELGLHYHRLVDAAALTAALTASDFTHPVPQRVDLRPMLWAAALALLLLPSATRLMQARRRRRLSRTSGT